MGTSCSEDDKFTNDPSVHLVFETDTVRFDTVFTSIGSSTKRFKVYNHHKDGLRIASVLLGSGGTSGFRINIDGHSGTFISDLEILGNDSLFVFAEVTVNPQDSDSPVFVRDSILFNLENGIRQQIILEAYGQDVIIMRGETFSADTLLNARRPYLIYDSLVVAANARLEIAAGTTLCFHNHAYLGVHGQIDCQGSQEEPVVMRGDRTDRMFPYLPYDRLDAQWGGVRLYPESKDNRFDYVDIHSGSWGIDCPLSTSDETKCTIRNSVIHNVAGDALHLFNCSAKVQNSQISNALGNCVTIIGGMCEFVHTTIAQFYPWNGLHGSAVYFANVQNDTIYPLLGANFYNCLITGSSTDEITGYPSEKPGMFRALFKNCLINIALSGNEPDSLLQIFAASVNETEKLNQKKPKLTQAEREEVVWGAKNFRLLDYDNFIYDFDLDSISPARGIGSDSYVSECTTDRLGRSRPTSKPDAGCYQYTPLKTQNQDEQ